MELGVALPTSGAIATPANIVRVAVEAERLGYAAVWTYERLLRPIAPMVQSGSDEPRPLPEIYRSTFEPLVTLSHVAAVTSTIKLGTSVVNAPLHPPVVLGRRFATLDQFSGGRVIAGLGQGWMGPEFDTVGIPASRKGAGFEEVIAALRAVWGPDPVAFDGRFYTIAPSEINPKPVRTIPVLVGAMTPKGIARAARIADGLNPVAVDEGALVGIVDAFRDGVRDAGRDPSTVTVVVRANVPVTSEPLDTDRPYLGGSPEQIADDIARLVGKGVDQVFFSNTAAHDIDEVIDQLARLKALVP